jgi:CCR4-NOT transcription complex subunit 9
MFLFLLDILGVVSILLQEIISVYPLLSPPALTAVASNRVCNALALLQCIASHNATRPLLLNGKFHFHSPFV